jgi:hypothetical protein
MIVKASELKKLLGDTKDADSIIADRIAKGLVENDLTAQPVFKSEAVEGLVKSLTEAIDRLNKMPEAAEPKANDRAQRLAKSQAAENAPEVVAAVNDVAGALEELHKSNVESQSALAKGLVKVAEAQSQTMRGLVDFAARFEAIAAKVEELHKSAATTVVAPAGVAATTQPGVAAPSPLDAAAQGGDFRGEKTFEEFLAKAKGVEDMIVKAQRNLSSEDRAGRRGQDLINASIALMSSNKPLSAIVAEFDLK